jgi:N4-gp56 family major capsid protein
MAHIYNAPNSSPSTIGTQLNTFYWDRKSLIEEAEKMYFSPLADVRNMPMHYGKELKVYHYVPLLDDRNVSDQGIDAAGVTLTGLTYQVTFPRLVMSIANAAKAGAVTAIEVDTSGIDATAGADDSAGIGFATVTITGGGGLVGTYPTESDANDVAALNIGAVVHVNSGNLYGSSKDVGTIVGKLPALSETGGRVNRVGFTRLERSGTLTEYGFFTEWTEESMIFDTDADLYSHMSRELLAGANEINEDLLQMDLLNSAGVVVYGGTATTDAEVTGVASASVATYADLKRLSITLDDNRTPKHTKVIKGSRMTDTATINAARVMYIGSELQTTVENMVDGLSNAAFVPVRKYADAATILNGEIGSVGDFRIVVVPNMMRWSGAGALEGTNPGFAVTNGRYDVVPMLVVGDASFATIGLQMSGKKGASQKFRIIVKKPGQEQATTQDPYGKIGFSSITFYYGFIALREERIGLIKTIAPE